LYASQLAKFHGLGTSSHFEKANLLSLMKMWSLFFAFLPIFYILYFFLPFLLGVFNTAAPNTTFQADDISIVVKKKATSGGGPKTSTQDPSKQP
jgi:hypothetical protein